MQWHKVECGSVDSTNDEAKRIARSYDGFIAVRADSQTAGRGQYGRKWMSPPGKNLLATFSVPKPMIMAPELLSLNIGAGLQKLLVKYSINAHCKWPNDVLVSGHKIAGILIEQIGKRYNIGIGLNCNWPEKRLSGETGILITGIMAETGIHVDISGIFNETGTIVYECLTSTAEDILERYRAAWNGTGRKIQVCIDAQWIPGIIRDIQKDGSLSVTTETQGESVITSSTQIKPGVE
jgi:BirA family biotin operon repressor/biotin-[acetyl-CoA-carboxylase] ligase